MQKRRSNGADGVELHVWNANGPARAFYEALGDAPIQIRCAGRVDSRSPRST